MGTFLFLLLFFFVLLPLGRVAWAAWRQWRMIKDHMRRAAEMQDAFYRATGQRQDSAAGAQADAPARRKKKIARDVGEYVAFEEMRTFTGSDEAAPAASDTPPAPQVEDADWEEIR